MFAGLQKLYLNKKHNFYVFKAFLLNQLELAVFLYNGYVSVTLGLAAGVFSILGSYMGAGIAIKKGSNVIRYAILFVLVLLFLKLAWEMLGQ